MLFCGVVGGHRVVISVTKKPRPRTKKRIPRIISDNTPGSSIPIQCRPCRGVVHVAIHTLNTHPTLTPQPPHPVLISKSYPIYVLSISHSSHYVIRVNMIHTGLIQDLQTENYIQNRTKEPPIIEPQLRTIQTNKPMNQKTNTLSHYTSHHHFSPPLSP